MDSDWAAKNLEVIRTLMERSALYRRALAPIMTLAGAIGTGASALALAANLQLPFPFYWLTVAIVATIGGTLLVRRQAVRDKEPFWSPPTRRVVKSVLPAFLIGLLVGLFWPSHNYFVLSGIWLVLYALGLHAAGAYMSRGIRLWAWILLVTSVLAQLLAMRDFYPTTGREAHIFMGATFGLMHLACGAYLYLTEKRNAA